MNEKLHAFLVLKRMVIDLLANFINICNFCNFLSAIALCPIDSAALSKIGSIYQILIL